METLGLELMYLMFLCGDIILVCSLSWLGSSRVSVSFAVSLRLGALHTCLWMILTPCTSNLYIQWPPSLGVLVVRGTSSQCWHQPWDNSAFLSLASSGQQCQVLDIIWKNQWCIFFLFRCIYYFQLCVCVYVCISGVCMYTFVLVLVEARDTGFPLDIGMWATSYGYWTQAFCKSSKYF